MTYDCEKTGIEINGKPHVVDFSDLKATLAEIEREYDSPFEWWHPVQQKWYKVRPADLRAGMVVRKNQSETHYFLISSGEKVWRYIPVYVEGIGNNNHWFEFLTWKHKCGIEELDMAPYMVKEGE